MTFRRGFVVIRVIWYDLIWIICVLPSKTKAWSISKPLGGWLRVENRAFKKEHEM